MKKRWFEILLGTVTGLGILATIAHLIYIIRAYQHCSIIQFIARELW